MSLLAGCMGTYAHAPENVRLCRAEASGGWTSSGTLDLDGSEYTLKVSDGGPAKLVRGPIPHVYWVRVDGYSLGRRAGRRAPPMVYDPAEAFIEIDGRRIPALSRAWESALVQGVLQPGRELAVPFDLNDLARDTFLGYFIAFAMPAPGVRSSYVLSPGTVVLDGKRVPIPLQHACHEEARTWFSPLR